MSFTVAVLLEDRAFGGHEEGGWYFNYGYPVSLPEAPQRRFKTLAKAQGYLSKLKPVIARINDGRYPTSSVLSEGNYRAYIFNSKVKGYPDTIPHWE
jgi:hypothetical protein